MQERGTYDGSTAGLRRPKSEQEAPDSMHGVLHEPDRLRKLEIHSDETGRPEWRRGQLMFLATVRQTHGPENGLRTCLDPDARLDRIPIPQLRDVHFSVGLHSSRRLDREL